MIYYVPDLTLEKSLDLAMQLDEIIPEDETIFDFSRMSNFDPLPMLIAGSKIRRLREKFPEKRFKVNGVESAGKRYAGNMGFFKYISPLLDIGKMPGEANGSKNYIPITPIEVDELLKIEREKGNYIALGDLLEREAERLSSIVDRGNAELHKLFTYLIREIFRNTPEHAQSNRMWICGQYWPSYELAEIAIIDEGIGIFNSIIKNRVHKEYIKDDLTALQWAIRAGISSAFNPSTQQNSNDEWANSGFGLYMVKEICQKLGGNFCIISYGNYLLIDGQNIKAGKTSFEGTAIRVRLLTRGIEDARDIIYKISLQGEAEARTIRNAFKKASLPSRGLMEDLRII